MVKLQYLDSFLVYRTNPPVIMNEVPSNRKKGVIYRVWAPTVKEGIDFIGNSSILKFKNLYKYFIPKRWQGTLYGQGNKIIKLDEAYDELDDILAQHRSSANLRNVDGVTTYLPNSSSRPLKGLNVLVEQNYLFEIVLKNPKDRRLMSVKGQNVLKALIQEYAYTKDNPSTNIVGMTYTEEITIIPMDLWFNSAEFTSPEKALRKNNKNFMGWMLNQLTNPSVLQNFGKIVLLYQNLVLIVDPAAIPETENKSDFLMGLYVNFIKRIKMLHTKTPQAEPSVAEEPVAITKKDTVKEVDAMIIDQDTEEIADKTMAVAERKTIDDEVVDDVLVKAKTNPDRVSKQTKEQLKTSIAGKKTKETQLEPTIPASAINHTDNIEVTSDDMDLLIKAQMEGRSIQSEKRNQILREKYKTVKLGASSLEQIVEEEKKYEVPELPVKAKTVNPSLTKLKTPEFERAYNENLAQYDLVSILLHFSKIQPPLYLNRDIKVEDASTDMERVIRYTVEFEDQDRKRHRFSFLMPKMYREKYLYLNDQELNISHQKIPYPITKVSPSRCQLVTNYNKIFTERYGTNLSPRTTKLKKVLSGADCPRNITVQHGDCSILNKSELTTVEYDDLGSNIMRISTVINKKMFTVYFVVNDARAVIPEYRKDEVFAISYDNQGVEAREIVKDETLFPVAVLSDRSNKEFFYLSGTSNLVYTSDGVPQGELSEFIINNLLQASPKLDEFFRDISTGSKFMYARSKIMDEWMPTILTLSAAEPGGLPVVLDKAKIKYKFLDKRPNVNKDVTGIIPFSDGYLIYDRYPYENSLLMNGLLVVPTKEISFYEMTERDTYVDLFDLMYNRRTLFDAMRNFYYLMVDPITLDVLNRLGMPTDFTTLMLYCVGTLVDNTFQIDASYKNSRVRSNEIINAYLYKELATAWEKWSSGREDKFSIWDRAVIKQLLTVQTVDPHSTLNVTLEAENDSLIKLKGPSGMNDDHSFTLEKRSYHPTMAGIIAMNSTASGEVGIGRHLTLNANIDDARGFVTINKDSYDGTELASGGELLQTFGIESADIERVAMAISQSKHLVPTSSNSAGLVSYDMERVIPYTSNDFAFHSKKAGKVVEIKDDLMIIQYSDGSYDDIDLSEHPDKNVDGGFYIMNQMKTDLKPGQKFEANEVLAYNPKYITTKDMLGDPVASVGCLARVVVESNGAVYEDSGYCTNNFAHRMSTKITTQKRVVLSPFANIKYIAKIGQELKPNDPILTFDDTEDAFSSQLLQSIAEEEGDEEQIIATNAPVICKTGGVVKDIYVYYTTPPSKMTPSLRKIVEDYIKKTGSRQKTLSKYINTSDANTKLKPIDQQIPDYSGKIKGVPVGEGVMIDFYIEYLDVLAAGDKSSSLRPGDVTEIN